jgi:hypothetical protein
MTIVLLVALLVVSCAVAVYSFSAERERRTILVRASAMGGLNAPVPLDILRDDAPWARRAAGDVAPRTLAEELVRRGSATEVLVHAGFDGPEAPLFYTSIRLAARRVPAVAGVHVRSARAPPAPRMLVGLASSPA